MTPSPLGSRSIFHVDVLKALCLFALVGLAFVLFAVSASAQNTYQPTLPDNSLTPDDPIGTPPKPTSNGTYEAVSNINGGLTFFLPVLTLPQRGGWNLTLGLYNNSPNWATRSDTSIELAVPMSGQNTYINYTNSILFGAAGGPLNWNVPTLQASIEYAGQITLATNLQGQPTDVAPVMCVTNWVFTDWSGNRHPFGNVTQCSAIGQQLAQVTDSTDGSWLRLNTTNYTSNITVITKDGTTYNFPALQGPFSGCNNPSCYNDGGWASTNGNVYAVYAQSFSSMVDSTGENTVTYSGSALTDTIGRTIKFANGGITYNDTNGNSQTVSVTPTQQTAQPYNFSLACSPGKTYSNTIVSEYYGYLSWSESPLTYTVTLPAVNSVSRIYTLEFDGVGNLLQASYPEGGYTKYAYQDYTFYRPAYNIQSCSHTEHQVVQKRECTISSGCSSSQELVTTYTPTPDGSVPFNDSVGIEDPLGNTTFVQNQNFATFPLTAPHETSRQIFPPGQYPSGTPLRTIQTTYTSYVYGVDIQLPASVTTTLNDASPNLSSVTNYQYETISPIFYCFGGCGTSGTPYINDATEIDVYDYASSGTGTALKKTAQTWMNSSNGTLYSISGSHLLDRLASRTITDPATNNQATLSYGYNSVGDITSKTVGGSGVTSLTTNYQRDTYGNITQMTDPKTYVTNFGYTDSWYQTTCAPSTNSSAYLTTITDALNHVTKFSYDSCSGLKGSTTDPNNQSTTYTYDALGRPLITTYADGGTVRNTYVDSAPNSVTTSSSITASLNKVQTTTLDGFGRTSESELTSDPDGTDKVDTTYDSLGRKATVSNPYRSTSDSTYGITSYTYDALDRTRTVTEPDNSVVTTTYSGNLTTVTDEAGKMRKSQADALGRLTYVWEDPAGLDYQTNYTYDAFGNLLTVLQSSSRQRTFSYNTLSQLVSATNPESNTITYTYDNDGNVQTKTSFAENQTDSTQTPATGSVTITGSPLCQPTCYTGTVYITVNGYQVSTNYGGSSTASGLASALASQLNNSSSPVTASASGPTVNMTTKAVGASANYSLSASVVPSKGFYATTSGSTLTGGSNPPTVTITYAYDKLNRLSSKTYTDGTPTVTYWYDGTAPTGCSPTLTAAYPIYRRTAMCDAMGWEAWSYNPTGHLTDDRRSTSSIVKDTLYTPNLDGSDASITYPITNRQITYTPGGAGLPLSASDGTTTYASAAHYAPQGALASLTNGGNIYSTFIYNSQLQPCWNYATTGSALPWNSATQCATTATTGTILDMKYNLNLGAGDNGNVIGITNNRDTTRSQTFAYDSLNRIATAGTVNTSGTNCWGETYGIDAWANLSSLALPSSYSSSCSHETPFSYTVPTSNQLPSASGFTYDAAGNLMASGLGNYVYNAEHQMTSETTGSVTTTYSYDGDGKRVEKSGGKIYWYGGGSDALDETDLSGNTNNATFSEYISVGGARTARRDYQSNVFYYFADHIGTSRELVQSGRTSPCYDADFYPYGGEIIHTNTCTQNYKFTGKERDSESGLDNFGARYNASTMGRFMSPDPGNIGVNRLNPQSWNAYSYSLNNPLSLTDPTGLYVCEDSVNCDSANDKAFAKSLADAQTAANKLTGDDQAAAQRAIDSYGAQGVDNGVNVRFDANVTGGVTEVSGVANGENDKANDNPNKQNINVTFNPNAVGDASLVAHEGSHVADGSAWVASGFSPNMNPTGLNTELNAYHVQFNVLNSLSTINAPPGMIPNGGFLNFKNGQLSWHAADTFKGITPDLQKKIEQNYENSALPAFQKGSVVPR